MNFLTESKQCLQALAVRMNRPCSGWTVAKPILHTVVCAKHAVTWHHSPSSQNLSNTLKRRNRLSS